jgi:hypothetical protein
MVNRGHDFESVAVVEGVVVSPRLEAEEEPRELVQGEIKWAEEGAVQVVPVCR